MPRNRYESLPAFQPFRITGAVDTAKPLGSNVSTTSAATITAGNGVTVTPASLSGIIEGTILNFSGGTGSAEDVTVLSVNQVAGTFTANLT